jgi:glycosyltransferase involved in cell wall biosynthesis
MTDDHSNDVLILVPVYNCARYLPELITRIRKYACEQNILLVNDGSSDNSLEIIKQQDVSYISFPENRGKGAALRAGFRFAVERGYRSVLTLDADLQHRPEEIPSFYALDNGETVVMGTRMISRGQMPFARWLVNNLTSLIISIFGTVRIRDSQSGFRLLPAALLRSVRLRTDRYDLESELLFKIGVLRYAVAEVPVTTVYEGSESSIRAGRDTLRFIRLIWRRLWI